MGLTSPSGALLQLASLSAHTGPEDLGLLAEPGGYLAHSKPFHPIGSSFTMPHLQPSKRLAKISLFLLWLIFRILAAGRTLNLSAPVPTTPRQMVKQKDSTEC